MNYQRLLTAAGVALLSLASGCASGSLKPLDSKPPLARIVLSKARDVSGWAGLMPPIKFHVILPPGIYQPMYEDDQAYYYQAPAKVIVNDLTSLMYDGGIYVLRGSGAPAGWYYINEDGTQTSGEFKTTTPGR